MAIQLDDEVTLPTPNGALSVRWAGDPAQPDIEVMIARVGPVGPDVEPLVRIHSECISGDVFGSSRCDCGSQFDAALDMIQTEGGVLVYVRGHEGRGIGLRLKLAAYRLQDAGDDTFAANRHLGQPEDARRYDVPAAALAALGLRKVRLLTDNPHKVAAVRAVGLEVAPTALPVEAPHESVAYLTAKRIWFGVTSAAR